MTLKLLHIIFEGEIAAYEVPAFRGAVIGAVGQELEHLAFHNHLDDRKYNYAYPRIIYRREGRQPALLCLGDGVREAVKLFDGEEQTLLLRDRALPLRVRSIRTDLYEPRLLDRAMRYRLRGWRALNQQNHRRYMAAKTEEERAELLRRAFTGNALSFAKGIGWTVPGRIEAEIRVESRPKTIQYKGLPLLTFDAEAETNLLLPRGIGLGRHASLGYGTVELLEAPPAPETVDE